MTNDECEKKKKRNRISAQISRDRKKQYLTDLEQENKRLSEETFNFQKENELLKEQLSKMNLGESSKMEEEPKKS